MGQAKDMLIDQMENACASCGEETNAPQDTRACDVCGDVVIRCFACYRSEGGKAVCGACQHTFSKED